MPEHLEKCVREVEKKSPGVNPWAICQTSLKGEIMNDDDILIYPSEFKCGMKEELEHSDITGGDKEMTKKIVLAHLKEDPKYYSKLGIKMKAEEERRQSPIQRSMKNVPREKDTIRNIKSVKAEEEVSKLTPHYKEPSKPEGYKMSPKEQVDTKIGLGIPNKAEEALPTQSDTDALNTYSKKLHEKSKAITGKTAPHIPLVHQTASDEDCGKKLSTKLVEQAEEALGTEKVDEVINKAEVEKFAEEKAKPARFEAEPAKAGIGNIIKKVLDPRPPALDKPSGPPLTKTSVRKSYTH